MLPTLHPERWTHTLRHRAKTFIGARPWLFFPIFRRRSTFDDLLVTRETDICIEGFPRSANSFAVGAFEHAQSEPIRIAHHTHVPANAMRACEWDIPTLVLIRDPYDAIVSGTALSKQIQEEEHGVDTPIQRVPFHFKLSSWHTFYRSLLPYHNKFLSAALGTVVEDMGTVIDRINERFGTEFDRFEHTPETVEEVHSGRGYHAGPSQRRADLKQETQADFDEHLEAGTALQRTLKRAKALFETFTSDLDTVQT